MNAVHIPFTGGQMQPSDVEAFKAVIKGGEQHSRVFVEQAIGF